MLDNEHADNYTSDEVRVNVKDRQEKAHRSAYAYKIYQGLVTSRNAGCPGMLGTLCLQALL